METRERAKLPPGQVKAVRWPVLHEGEVPRYPPDLKGWSFRSFGLVERESSWDYDAFRALGHRELEADFHCVTRWSLLDTRWAGVPFRAVHAAAKVGPGARFALVHAEGGYTTNIPLEHLLDDDVLFVHTWQGKPLPPEHGWPLRLFVPKLYGWKACKWVRAIEFRTDDHPGFWELRGYHRRGDPWREERFGRPGDPID